jgi:hypothetical protein
MIGSVSHACGVVAVAALQSGTGIDETGQVPSQNVLYQYFITLVEG